MFREYNGPLLFLCLQEKPLAKSLQRGEDPQFDQVNVTQYTELALYILCDFISHLNT